MSACLTQVRYALLTTVNYGRISLWEIAVHLAVAGGVYDGVFLCCTFSHEMSWMRSWT